MILHYFGTFVAYTGLMILVIYGVYLYCRKSPWAKSLLQGKAGGSMPAPLQNARQLTVDSVLSLEPRKSLYVVRSGHERFLLATSDEGTQFLSAMAPLSEAELDCLDTGLNAPEPIPPMPSWWASAQQVGRLLAARLSWTQADTARAKPVTERSWLRRAVSSGFGNGED